jgi:hypothetical protein
MRSWRASRGLADFAIAHQQQPLRHALCLPAIMRHQQQGHALSATVSDQVFDESCRAFVERCCGLVKQKGFRLATKRAGKRKPLALSGGKASDIPFQGTGEPQPLHEPWRIELRGKVIANAIRPPSGFGRHEANPLSPLAGRHGVPRVYADTDVSAAGIEIDDRTQEERFARSRWAHQRQTFPGGNVETYRADQFGCELPDPQR